MTRGMDGFGDALTLGKNKDWELKACVTSLEPDQPEAEK